MASYRPLTDIPLSLLTSNGDLATGYVLYAYVTNTTTPATLYQDASGTPAGSSVTLDSRGEPTTIKRIWLDTSVTYKLTLKTDAGVTVWTADPVYGGASNDGVVASGAGYARPLSDYFGDRINVLNYYSGTGDFDSAISAAISEAEARGGGVVWFPWRLAGYTFEMITVDAQNISFYGDNADIIYKWSAASQSAGLTGGTYKASPAFLIKPSAGKNKFRGLRFSQYAGFPTTYSGSFTSAATFAAIIAQRADYVDIQDCYFDTDSGRAAYWRGGNYGVFRNNTLIDSSVIAHIGEVSDTLFWDNSTDTSTRYSPWCLSVDHNKIVGSNTTRLAPHSIFMTGVVAPHVCDNELYGLNIDGASAGDGIRIYANDLGLFNQDGSARTKHQMIVRNNQIFGTVGSGINITCDSLSGSDTTSYGSVSGNNIDVTGLGIYVERGIGLRLSENEIVSTSSPLVIADDCSGLRSSRNKYECTSGGESYRTISVRSTASLTDVWFSGDWVYSTASDIYAIDTSNATLGFETGGIIDCTFVFASQSVSSRILQLSQSKGAITVTGNTFDIRDTGINNRIVVSIDEATAVNTSVTFSGNKTVSNNSTSYVSRGVAINNSDTCIVSGNDVGNMSIVCSGDVFVHDNYITNGIALVTPLTVDGAARVKCHDNNIQHTITTNAITAEFISCTISDVHNNTLVANSTSAMIRATTAGSLYVSGNDYNNASSGAPVAVTGTAKIGGDLGAYKTTNGSTLWTDANRLSASDMKPGTRFWNSSDNAYNESNGTGWYLAGAAT